MIFQGICDMLLCIKRPLDGSVKREIQKIQIKYPITLTRFIIHHRFSDIPSQFNQVCKYYLHLKRWHFLKF